LAVAIKTGALIVIFEEQAGIEAGFPEKAVGSAKWPYPPSVHAGFASFREIARHAVLVPGDAAAGRIRNDCMAGLDAERRLQDRRADYQPALPRPASCRPGMPGTTAEARMKANREVQDSY